MHRRVPLAPLRYGFFAGLLPAPFVTVSRYAQERCQPDVLVIFIDGDDVSDSLRENGVLTHCWWQIGARDASSEEASPTAVKTVTHKMLLAR